MYLKSEDLKIGINAHSDLGVTAYGIFFRKGLTATTGMKDPRLGSPAFFAGFLLYGGGSGHVCCDALPRTPLRTVEYACGILACALRVFCANSLRRSPDTFPDRGNDCVAWAALGNAFRGPGFKHRICLTALLEYG